MKIKHLLLGMLAMAAAVACKQDEPVEEAKLEISTETVALEATAAEATFEVTSNNDWTATADADWVTLDPASGAGAAEAVTVKVTAEDNETTEARTATVTVKSGELTKTVALTQAGTEVEPLPTPNVDWTSDAVVSYDLPEGASSKRQLLKNIKYTFDENYLYVKLQASAAEFAAAPAEYLGIFVYDVTDGSGDGYYGWWNDAKGNVELEGEHIGVFSGKDITLTIGETPVEVVTEENGDELVWTMNILRSAHENLALENPHFAFLTYIGWEPNGALPDKYENMLQFTPAAPEPVVKVERGLAFAAATAEAVLGEAFTAPALSGEAAGVVYTSSNTAVATVDAATGAVTLVAAGETTITAAAEENETHLAGSASYTLTVVEPTPEPDGTEANPYLVADAAALQGMGALLVADATTYFKLTANIDLAGTEWARINTSETVEDATIVKAIALDGGNYTISNAPEALFSTLYGSVQNLTIDGSKITVVRTSAGALADVVSNAAIKNVTVKNLSISNAATENNKGYTGGLCGRLLAGSVENVTVAGVLDGRERLGMLIGNLVDGTVKNCSVSGEITGINYYIGGLVGMMNGGSVENCSSSANAVTASTAYGRIGGLIGQVEGGSISGSNASGSVTSGGHYGGGFIGVLAKDNEIRVSKCYATGAVNLPSTVNKSGGAGFIGAIENNGTFIISDCYSTAAVTAHRWSGAFIGRAMSSSKVTITNCYSKSACTFTQPANCGSLVGDVATTATLTYSGAIAWNLAAGVELFVRPGVTEAPEGNYFGIEGTISEKAKAFGWDTAIWDLSKDDPTLK